LKTLQGAAPEFGVKLLPLEFAKPNTARAFDTLRGERPGALNVLGWGLIGRYRKQIADFAIENRLPTMFSGKKYVVAGGLMSYGVDNVNRYRRAATYVHKILQGAKPANLPVEQPTRFTLTINLKTAKALGIKFPRAILLRADEVIE
jgi:putative ABC transport system substrate-binding protein